MLHSHKNLVYTQRYYSGIPNSEISFEEYQRAKHIPVYGYNLENICEDYKSIPPSAKSVGELALQNYNQWVELDLNQVSPNYITYVNLGKMNLTVSQKNKNKSVITTDFLLFCCFFQFPRPK